MNLCLCLCLWSVRIERTQHCIFHAYSSILHHLYAGIGAQTTRPGNQVAAEGTRAGRTAVGTRLKRDEVSRNQLSHREAEQPWMTKKQGGFVFFTLIPSSCLYSPLPNRISCYTSSKFFLKRKQPQFPKTKQNGLLNVDISRILFSY